MSESTLQKIGVRVQELRKQQGLSKTEFALMDITPRERWSDINRYLVRHGQVVCLPNHPHCERCPVSQWCDHGSEVLGRK